MSTPLKDAIALHRDSRTHAPTFNLPLIPPIDEDHCSAWGRQLAKVASKWERRKATPDLWHQIPARPGLYFFVWRIPVEFSMDDHPNHCFRFLLYCGQAGAGDSKNTLRDRYKNEYSVYLKGDPENLFSASSPMRRKELLGRWLLLHPLEYWWAEVDDKSKLADLEKELIRILAPPLNTQHNQLTVAARRPAF